MMKRLLASLIVLTFMLPTVMPWLSHDVLDALHTRLEAHHYTPESQHDHGHEHIAEANVADHAAHFDIISFFDNLHIELKNPTVAKLLVSQASLQDMPFVMATNHLMDALMSWTPILGQGPPAYPPDVHIASLGVPVYLATLRIRI